MKNKPAQEISVKESPAAVCPCSESCPLGDALSVIGGKWKMRIICTLYVDGTQRYNDILKKTAGITNTMLAASLKDLEADGIIIRNQYAQIPPRVEYSLTEHGKELWPILHRFIHWARNEEFDGDESFVRNEKACIKACGEKERIQWKNGNQP